MALKTILFGALFAIAQASDIGEDSNHKANPIRKVVKMLQDMQRKVEQEAKEEEEMYEKYMCYCKTSGKDLAEGIAAADAKIPNLGSDIEASEAEKVQIDETIKKSQNERAAAKAAMADATAIREKEAAAYAKEKGDMDTNIAAIEKALTALGMGSSGAFVQTDSAAVLRKLLASTALLAEVEKDEVVSFFSGSQDAPSSLEVIGILKEMGDQMKADRIKVVEAEETAVKEYDALIAAKKKQIAALTATVETSMTRSADLGVSIAGMKNDLTDTQAALLEDQKFVADLSKNCDTKTSEWDEIVKTRNEELVAISETIKILNDDDALDLFTKTLPSASASFVQMSKAGTRMQALAHVKIITGKDAGHKFRLDMIALALHGKQAGFEKVIEMIDDMVKTLQQEQVDDESKKEYCIKQFDMIDDKKKGLERSIADTETAMANAEEELKATEEEIDALQKGLKELDANVAQSTAQRKSEHELYTQTMQDTSAAKELLALAKNRLHKFYNPKLHMTTPAPVLSREDQIASAFDGASFLQRAHVRRHTVSRSAGDEAPPPPPAAPGAYSKKAEESGGVIAMIDLLIKDLDAQMTEAKTEENNSQQAYTQMMSDAMDTRTADSRSFTEKEVMKGNLESELESLKESKSSATKELGATAAYMGQLHGECDWLLQYFDQRKEARASEISSLGDAKAVLAGADFSMLQMNGEAQQGRLLAISGGHLRASRA